MTSEVLMGIAGAIQASAFNALATRLLSTVPGLPPIVQTVHLLGIASVMGSTVLLDLRLLGLALPSQPARELARRVMPWLWCALPCLAASGLLFVVARPQRYFSNPVFLFKFTMLAPAVVLAITLQRLLGASDTEEDTRRPGIKLLATASLACWVLVVLAGRWIAYADYLLPE